MKITIEQMEYYIVEMKKAQNEHPKAKIYYDWEDCEIRITYPLPNDYFQMLGALDNKFNKDNL